jgi:hypothetical protein
MTTAQREQLENLVLTVLREAGEPLTIPQIEAKLAGKVTVDTFDVRDAVWRLVAQRRAQFTPRRYVKVAEK